MAPSESVDAPASTALRPGAEPHSQSGSLGPSPAIADSPAPGPAQVWILAARSQPATRIWGLDGCERLRRSLTARENVAGVTVLASEASRDAAGEPSERSQAESQSPSQSQSEWDLRGQSGRCVAIRADHVYDDRILDGLLAAPDGILALHPPLAGRTDWLAAWGPGESLPDFVAALRRSEGEGAAPCPTGVTPVAPDDLAAAYDPQLRKRAAAFVLPARPDSARAIENRIFASSYKGLTDLVTKWVWPLPARAATRALARRGIRPNTVTAVSYLLCALALLLFAAGWFGTGLAVGWVMTFLDTVDGKLARCTLTSSRLGDVLDHGLDLVHPPFWWIAFAMGLGLATPGVEPAMWIIVGGYLLGRLLEGIFMLAFKMEIFLWRPFDGFFRTIIARRNPNMLLLTAGVLAGRPEAGFFAVAAWTAISNLVHAVRLVQAFAQRQRGAAVRPWFEEEATA